LQKLWAIDPGYDRNNVLMFSLDPRLAGYNDSAKLGDIYRRLLGSLRELPAVRSASASLVRPVDDEAYWVNVVESIDGHKLPENHGVRGIPVAVNRLASEYFATIGTPMMIGREFGPEDNEKSAPVAVISEKLARECFGNENAVGRYVSDHDDGGFQVIGVVKGSRYGGVREQPRSVLYLPFFQQDLAQASFTPTFEMRYSGTLSSMLDAVRHTVSSIDANLTLFRVKTLEVQTADSLVIERLIAMLSTFFGLLAGLLACIGLYGTMAYRVARRTGEIGVRMALGAQRGDVRWMVLRETVVLITVGTVIGVLLSFETSRLIASRLYGVNATDVLTLSVTTLFLASVAVVAGYVPARRASRIDPMVALRYE
jgi:predicted permease